VKNQLTVRSSVLFMFTALAFVASLGLLSCSDALPGTSFPVTVTWSGGGSAASRGLIDGSVTSVAILVYNGSGERIGSGTLINAGSFWSGRITVSETGSAVFEINALNSLGSILYVGRITQTLSGSGDIVTITAGTAGLKGGSIQGQPVALSTMMVNTFAGTAGTAGAMSAVNAIGTAALFTNPYGVTTDGTNLYIADEGTHNIRKMVIATQEVSVFAGHIGTAAAYTDAAGTGAGFTSPRAITTDGIYLYVSDAGNNIRRVLIASPQTVALYVGSGSQTAGSTTDVVGSAALFNQIRGLTYFGGYLYVADTGNHTIRRVHVAADSTRDVITFAGLTGSAAFTEGSGSTARFNGPQGITNDGTNLYVADTINNKIRKVPMDGTATSTVASGVTFSSPIGITTDGTYLYVTESVGKIIRRIKISDETTDTIAGAGTPRDATHGDGMGVAAYFAGPYGITTDGTNLYVSDYTAPYGYTIRKIQ
ncbi:MAG: hypothetical protein Q8O15_00050, partial [Rectinemataceae bacterium]|nr:hypothetical protein [Rectinemataceae bacterium]